MDYTKPFSITDPFIHAYVFNVWSDRSLVTMHDLEYPKYETEEQFAHINEAWLKNRAWWSQHHAPEFLPKPKRRVGRPADTAKAKAREEARAKKEADREARELERRAQREAREAERAEKARRAEERKNALLERARSNGTVVLTMKIPDDVLAAIVSVKGELTTPECVVQLLRIALSLPDPSDGKSPQNVTP